MIIIMVGLRLRTQLVPCAPNEIRTHASKQYTSSVFSDVACCQRIAHGWSFNMKNETARDMFHTKASCHDVLFATWWIQAGAN